LRYFHYFPVFFFYFFHQNESNCIHPRVFGESKDICKFKALKKTGKNNQLIERKLTFQEEIRKNSQRLPERKEIKKGLKLVKGIDSFGASLSRFNPFKSKTTHIPIPASDEEYTITSVEVSRTTYSVICSIYSINFIS
jgi:hypothetical protein